MEKKSESTFSLYPKSEKEYFRLFRWKISKRLILACILVAGLTSLICLLVSHISKEETKTPDNIKTYSYKSLLLGFVSDKVRIKAEAGYVAYEGEVKAGAVTGQGTLYGRNGNVIYTGEFENNQYSGTGRLYDESGALLYEGEFVNNLYEGEGKEYGTGGNLRYEGSFHQGTWNGTGVLYDGGSNIVYTGNFSKGAIVYSDFLGKTTEEVTQMYSGNTVIRYDSSLFAVNMTDISAVYSAAADENSLEEAVHVNKIFVKNTVCRIGAVSIRNMEQMKDFAGNPLYEGYVYINAEEAAALPELSGLTYSDTFDDAMEITGYDRDKTLYIYSFSIDRLKYTFYTEKQDGTFIMYAIEVYDGGEEETDE